MSNRPPAPTDERGVPIVPTDFSECYDECKFGDKRNNRHHILYPKGEYRSPTQRRARLAEQMVVQACVCKHDDYHSTYTNAPRPAYKVLCELACGVLEPTVSPVEIRRLR